MKKYLKLLALLPLLCGLVIVVSCNKDDDTIGNGFTIIATNVINDIEQISTVKVIFLEEIEIAQAPYLNNGFELKLPASVSYRYMFPIEYMVHEGDAMMISDKNASAFAITPNNIFGFDQNGNRIGSFVLASFDRNMFVQWYLVDRDVTVKGEVGDGEELGYDLDLKKGWNPVYISMDYSRTPVMKFTTENPYDTELKWFFVEL